MFDQVIIEVTRRCNMSCLHCLRGEPQNINISDNVLNNFLTLFKNQKINTITISGGEPSIVPEKVSKIIHLIKINNIKINNIYLMTNGTNSTFIKTFRRKSNGVFDNIHINKSSDPFHFEKRAFNSWLKNIDECLEYYKSKGYSLIKQGRAKNLNIKDDFNIGTFRLPWQKHSVIYLNCNGDIIRDAYFDYETQNFKPLIICNINQIQRLRDFKSFCKKYKKTPGAQIETIEQLLAMQSINSSV